MSVQALQLSDGRDEWDEFVFPAVDEKQRLELISLFVCVFRGAIYLLSHFFSTVSMPHFPISAASVIPPTYSMGVL